MTTEASRVAPAGSAPDPTPPPHPAPRTHPAHPARPTRPTRPTEVFAWRTRLLPGSEELYTRTHRRIPEPVAAALRAVGVVDWRIWRDGLTLFHVIETTDGQDAMGARMAEFGPIDPAWDALIATMLDASAEAQAAPELVWGMDGGAQFP